ncbi:MAG: hypothetical protein ACAH80_16725 [Alphaproteobacteria bacterium]
MTASAPSCTLLPPKGTQARQLALAFITLAPLAIGVLAMMLGQDTNWDLRNYHWYNAWALWTGRYGSGIDFLPSQAQFFHNPTLDVPFYLLATALPLQLAFFILSCVQGLNASLLFMLAHLSLDMPDAKRKVMACAALATLGMLGGTGISELGTVFYDNVTSLGIFLSALLVILNFEKITTAPYKKIAFLTLLFGIPAGLAAGLKLTSVSFSIGLCFAVLVTPQDRWRGFWLAFFFGCGITLGFLAGYAHWGWYLFTHFDSPTFPYFNSIFQAPLLPPENFQDFRVPAEWRWAVPYRMAVNPLLVGEIIWRDWRVPALYTLVWVAVTGVLVSGRRGAGGSLAHDTPARFLLWMTGGAYVVWVTLQAVYRYILPIEMLSPLLIVFCINLLPLERRTRATFAMALLAALALTIKPGDWGRRDGWSHAIADITAPVVRENTMALMTTNDAYAFLLPRFPPETAFLRIHSRAFHSDRDFGINALIKSKIDAHTGPLMAFYPARRQDITADALRDYGLRITGTCQDIKDKTYTPLLDKRNAGDEYPPLYSLCPVSKASAPRKKR